MSSLLGESAQSVRIDVLLYPLGVWVAMAVVAVLNGGFREVVLIGFPLQERKGSWKKRHHVKGKARTK